MATERTKAELETYFNTGDIPTEAQFADFIASYENLKDGNLLVGSDPAITAFAGGGQANAYQLTKKMNEVTVVAVVNDSIKVGSALVGRVYWITNSGANAMNLYPAVGEQISGGGANNPVSIAAGVSRRYICVIAGDWKFNTLA